MAKTGTALEQTQAAALNYELRGLRRGPDVAVLLQVRGVRKRKPMDRVPSGDDAEVS
jgi:hypothetical protein